MKTVELAETPKGTPLVYRKVWKTARPTENIPVTFLGLHTDQSCPGRYVKKAMVILPDGREASLSVTVLRRPVA